jgi:DNA mismatch endonuclease (patch repair protein)
MATDVFSSSQRSAVMARVRGKDTAPEKAVRSLLHRLGYRFRLHRTDLPGTPDITLPGRRAVILVHGCFWHQHMGCKHAARPASNREYWDTKLNSNMARDTTNIRSLKKLGWKVLVVWECRVNKPDRLSAWLTRRLG